MDTVPDYESDFVGWAEHQASIVRKLSGVDGLDTDNLAEEIGDLGRSEIRAASSLVRQLLSHLIKLAAEPDAQSRRHWMEEARRFQFDAVMASSGGVKQRIEIAKVWRSASNEAIDSLGAYGTEIEKLPAECPFSLDELLQDDFDPMAKFHRIDVSVKSGRKG